MSANNNEETATSAAADDDTAVVDAVAERLQFFFSDANVRQDFFIRKLLMGGVGSDGGNDEKKEQDDNEYPHQVPVEALLRFNTIKKHTTDPAIIVKAAKKLSDMLTISKDEKAIGRVQAFTSEKMSENIPLTLYVSNLPIHKGSDKQHKHESYACSTQEIRELFEPYGKVALVKLRFKRPLASTREEEDDDLVVVVGQNDNSPAASSPPPPGNKKQQQRRAPLGAALVEFETAQELEKAAADVLTSKSGGAEQLDPKRKLTIGESKNVLQVITLKDFLEQRKEEKETPPTNGNDAASNKEGGEESSPSRSKKRELEAEQQTTPVKQFTWDWKPGCVIRLKGLSSQCDREAILDAVAQGLDITVEQAKRERKVYADFSRGQVDGAIRFAEPDDVADMCKKIASGDIEIAGAKVEEATVLEGEEEKKYWSDFIEFKNKQIQHKAEERSAHKKRARR